MSPLLTEDQGAEPPRLLAPTRPRYSISSPGVKENPAVRGGEVSNCHAWTTTASPGPPFALFGALGSLGRLLGYEASREAVSRSEGRGRLSPEAVGGVALVAALALLVLRRRGSLRTR